MNAATKLAGTQRCRVGDLVMIVRSKNPARLGRVGVVVCATTDVAAVALACPEDLPEVQRRDWVVDFQGAPDVTVRDGQLLVTNRMACVGSALIPLRAPGEDLSEDVSMTMGAEA